MRKKWLYTWITANQSAVCVSAAPAILSDFHVWHFWMFLPMLVFTMHPAPGIGEYAIEVSSKLIQRILPVTFSVT